VEQRDGPMMLQRYRHWLALATTLVALASCDLNPQPVLPADREASDPTIGGGGTKSGGNGSPEPELPGNSDSGEGGASGISGPSAGGAPADGAGGESTAGVGGESGGAAGSDSAGSTGSAGAPP
jgi:hypothetical protein